jgi:hydroxymethylbilane synthase
MALQPVLLGTRGSPLARVQTEEVAAALRDRFPQRRFALKVLRTQGDRDRETPLPELGLGIFTGEIERALLAGEVQLAVHSMKDLATELPPGLSIGAVPPRRDPRDALASPSGRRLAELPPSARVGTSSPRRAALVRALRPDVKVAPIRGNVETRLAKADRDSYDAVVVAAVGVERLGLAEKIVEYFDPLTFIPAVGQGALALELRTEDQETAELLRELNHGPSWAAVLAERAFLRALGGGCRVPMAAYGRAQGTTLTLVGLVIAEDGSRAFRGQVTASLEAPEEAGGWLARELLEQGAGELVAAGGSV